MDIENLRAFLAIAESGSFSRAAERVFVTQPAISKRIAALEAELGTKLFDRINRRVHLTPAGRALQVRAHALLEEIADIKRGLAALAGHIGGELRIATSHHIGLHRLPPALQAFSQQFPQVRLDLRFMDSEQGCNAVLRGEVELAVVTLPAQAAPQLRTIPVWDDPLALVVAHNHALASATVQEALRDYPALLPGPGTFTRELILNAFGGMRAQLRMGIASNYLEVLKMLVGIGLGWSALPQTLIDGSLKVVHIQNIHIGRTLGLVLHRTRTLSNAGQALIDIVRATDSK